MRLTQIRDFLAVLDAGSINAAARKLGVSQPGLTKSLASLEAELGTLLLRRSPSGVTLTRQGQTFHVRASAAYAELLKAQAELAHEGQTPVALGFGPFFAAQIVPMAVKRWREKFPAVPLRLVEGLRHLTGPMVRDGTLDMVLAPRPQPGDEDPAIRFKPIAHLALIVVARRGHPMAQARSAADLPRVEWLCSLRRDAGARALQALGVPQPAQITECESFSATRTLLAESDLLGLVPHPFLDMPQVAQTIVQIAISERLPGMTVGLHTRADAPLSRPAAALARLVSDIGRLVLQRPPAP